MGKVVSTLRDIGTLAWRNIRVIVVAAAALVVVWMLGQLASGEIMQIDVAAYEFFVQGLRNDALTPFVETVTSLATPVVLVVVWAVAAAFAPGRRPGLAMAINLVAAVIINQVLKFVVQRPRPDGFNLVVETGFSFPSGHSMAAMAFYGFLAYLVWHCEKDRLKRWVWCVVLSIIIVCVGLSRIYLGVHYASDVLAGFLISLAWLAVFTKVFCPLLLPERDQASPSPGDDAPHAG